MRPRRVATIGFGRLGRSCANAIALDDQLVLAGIVRRAKTVMEPLPTPFSTVPAVTHISEISNVDAALVCAS